MLAARFRAAIAFTGAVFAANLRAQAPSPLPDAIRVTVSINADGTRTTYEFDAASHRATATTTTKDGNTIGKVRYVLDDAGRFASGDVYGPNEQFRFKTLYKYDAAGKLTQETQLGADDAVRNKIVYAYDKNGRQTGYSVYDTAGKLVRRTPNVAPPRSPSPAKRK
jgi:YD repeat-containing protein